MQNAHENLICSYLEYKSMNILVIWELIVKVAPSCNNNVSERFNLRIVSSTEETHHQTSWNPNFDALKSFALCFLQTLAPSPELYLL